MTEYYYLNTQNAPQGPHTLAELAGMMASGRVSPTTLIACRGGHNWEPLGSVLSRENVEPVTYIPAEGQVGTCPTCQRSLEQDIEGGQLPTRCPNCNRAFRATKPGIWSHFRLALSNYAKFSGRATRMEYWSFQLINCLILITVYIILVLAAIGASLSSIVEYEAGVEISGWNSSSAIACTVLMVGSIIALFGWTLFSFIPNLSVTVRRLHDRGWSGLWLLGYFCLCCIMPALMIPLAMADSASGDDPNTVYLALMGVSYIAVYGLAIFLFVLMLLDSQRGANQYGPSPKYPLG